MADPVFPPPDATNGNRVVFFFNQRGFGWTETYFFNSENAGFPNLLADVRTLASQRRALLVPSASIAGIRVQGALDPTQGSFLTQSTQDGCGPGEANVVETADEPTWDGILVNMYDAGYLYRRTLILRGLPSTYVSFTGRGDDQTTVRGAAAVEGFMDLLAVRFAQGRQVNLGGNPCIMGRDKRLTVTLPQKILSAVPDSTGCQTIFTLAPGSVAPPLGSKVHIGKLAGCGAKGLAGDGIVTNVNVLAITVTRSPACCGPITVGPNAVMSRIVPGFWNIAHYTYGRLVHRDTGGAFFSTRGRRSASKR